jgi:hypothetical protein
MADDFYTPSQIETQRAIAKALLDESNKTPEGHSGHFTAVSPLAPFAQMAQALVGGLGNRSATAMERSVERSMPGYVPPPGVDPDRAAAASPDTAAPDEDTAAPAAYAPLIEDAATKSGLDKALLTRQIKQESGFDPKSRSPAGAMGISQFMPGTAKDYKVDPWKPESAIPGQAKYDSDMIAKFGGNTGLGLAAYNWGPGNMQKWLASGANPAAMPAETRNYVQKITGQPIESWLAKTKQPGPQSDLGGSALGGGTPVRMAFNGEPSQAPIQMPGSPAAMSTALAGPEAGPSVLPVVAPPEGGAEAPTRVAGGPTPAVGGAPAGMAHTPAGALATVPGLTPGRMPVSRQQFEQASAMYRHNPNDAAARMVMEAYYSQGQPQTFQTPYGTITRGANGGQAFMESPPFEVTQHGPDGIAVTIKYRYDQNGRMVPLPGQEDLLGKLSPGSAGPAPSPVKPDRLGPDEPAAPAVAPPAPKPPVAPPAVPGKRGEAEPAVAPPVKLAALEQGGTMSDAPPPGAGMLAQVPPAEAVPPAGAKVAQEGAMGGLMGNMLQTGIDYTGAKENVKELAKTNVKQLTDATDSALKTREGARLQVGQLNILNDLVKNSAMIQTPGADINYAMDKVMAYFGNPEAAKRVGATQTFDKTVATNILDNMRTKLQGLGQVRLAEIELLKTAAASKYNTPEANRAILDVLTKYNNLAIKVGDITEQYRQGVRWDAKGNPIVGKDGNAVLASANSANPVELKSVVNKYLENHHPYDEKEAEALTKVFKNQPAEGEKKAEPSAPLATPKMPEGFKKNPRPSPASSAPEVPL